MAALRSIPRQYRYKQPLTDVFNWFLGLILTCVNQAIMDITRPLGVGHYGMCFTSHIA